MTKGPELRIAEEEVRVVQGRRILLRTPVSKLAEALAAVRDGGPRIGILPRGVRAWIERRDATAVALELPAQARTVRWIAEDSEEPFGRDARYRDVLLSLPYLVILLVLRRGRLTGVQQLYYRTEPLTPDGDDALQLPNLYNVAEGYGQRCWLCLQHVEVPRGAGIAACLEAVAGHVLQAAFNRSAEVHEGNSWWERSRDLDPRIASVDAWEEATRADPWFALRVPWRPAETTVARELRDMLDRVVAPAAAAPDATWLAGVLAGSASLTVKRTGS